MASRRQKWEGKRNNAEKLEVRQDLGVIETCLDPASSPFPPEVSVV